MPTIFGFPLALSKYWITQPNAFCWKQTAWKKLWWMHARAGPGGKLAATWRHWPGRHLVRSASRHQHCGQMRQNRASNCLTTLAFKSAFICICCLAKDQEMCCVMVVMTVWVFMWGEVSCCHQEMSLVSGVTRRGQSLHPPHLSADTSSQRKDNPDSVLC